MEVRKSDFGFEVKGLGFGVQALGFELSSSGARVEGGHLAGGAYPFGLKLGLSLMSIIRITCCTTRAAATSHPNAGPWT